MNKSKFVQFVVSLFVSPKSKTRSELLVELRTLTNQFTQSQSMALEPVPVPWDPNDCVNLGNIIAALQTTYSRECPII